MGHPLCFNKFAKVLKLHYITLLQQLFGPPIASVYLLMTRLE